MNLKKNIAYSIIINLFCFLNIFSADTSITRNPLIRAAAPEHNQSSVLLMKIPQDIRNCILSKDLINSTRPIGQSIKDALNLSATCTYFDQMLPYFGKLLQSYDFELRKATMNKMLKNINDDRYRSEHRSMLLLAHAGYNSISECFIIKDDYEMLSAVFAHKADPNQCGSIIGQPLFFFIKTQKIAKLFIDHGANLQLRTERQTKENLLEYRTRISTNEQVKTTAFYIERGCNPREIDDKGNCLFHHVNIDYSSSVHTLFLLQLIPDMINTINHQGLTPLDHLINSSFISNYRKEKFISLFKQFNAKTANQLTLEKAAQELIQKQILPVAEPEHTPAQEKIIENNKKAECLICFEERILSLIPCGKIHADQICGDCLKELKKKLNKCPLCSADIQNNE